MKSSPGGSKAVFARPAAPAPVDWVWGGLGVGAATASSAFAIYMLAFGPPAPKPGATPNFGVFATMRPRAFAGASRDVPSPQQTADLARTAAPADVAGPAPSIDFAPTGSVSQGRSADPAPASAAQSASRGAMLPGYVLRDVFDGKALVESRNALSLVAPGSTIDGAGEVLAIERRGDRWIVATTRGLIGAPSR